MKKILVVDDEKSVTNNLSSLFSVIGHEMVIALHGQKALDIINSEPIDLILLDIRMPNVDGIKIIKHIRKKNMKIKILVITSYSDEVLDEVEALNVDGFFKKPIDLTELMDRIKFVLDAKEDTRVYPSKIVSEKEEERAVTKAKLLFVEPGPMTYGFTCGLFECKDEHSNADYTIKVAYDVKEAIHMLSEYHPDIVIIYDAFYNLDEFQKLGEFILNMAIHPKSVVLHSLVPRTELEILRLKKSGIDFCNQNVLDDAKFRQVNQKLFTHIRKKCIEKKLVKSS